VWPTFADQALTSPLVPGSLDQISMVWPIWIVFIAFLASRSGPGQALPRASTTLSLSMAMRSVSLSGVSLLFPYELPLFAKTFAILNDLGVAAIWGAPLPTELTALQEMQYAQIWHTMVSLAMIVMTGLVVIWMTDRPIGSQGAPDHRVAATPEATSV